MTTLFELIRDDFLDDAAAMRALVRATVNDTTAHPKARVAASNSATLLLAATFEEAIRQFAREFSKTVVRKISSLDRLPPKLAATAWKRAMENLARFNIGEQSGSNFSVAQSKFNAVHEFCKGDLGQDIYEDLIHNENNMRPEQLNSLFKISGLKNACLKVAGHSEIHILFGENDAGKSHTKLLEAFENFFERRNSIAHALNSGSSSGPAQLEADIWLMEKFCLALTKVLIEETTPRNPQEAREFPQAIEIAAPIIPDELDSTLVTGSQVSDQAGAAAD